MPWYPRCLPHEAHDMGRTPVVGIDTDTDDLTPADEAKSEMEEFVDPDCKELVVFAFLGIGGFAEKNEF